MPQNIFAQRDMHLKDKQIEFGKQIKVSNGLKKFPYLTQNLMIKRPKMD